MAKGRAHLRNRGNPELRGFAIALVLLVLASLAAVVTLNILYLGR